MLRKHASIPEKVYFTSYGTREVFVGPYLEMNKKKVTSSGTSFSPSIPRVGSATYSEWKNDPITDVRLIGNHSALLNKQYDTYVNDHFLADIAFHGLTNSKGQIKGSYQFALIGDKLELIRVGSDLYRQVVDSEKRFKAPKLKKNEFKRGNIYVTPGGMKSLFLGRINTRTKIWGNDKYETAKCNNLMLFHQMNQNLFKDQDFSLDNLEIWNLETKKTTSFVESIGKVKVPNDVVPLIRNVMTKEFKSFLAAGNFKSVYGYNVLPQKFAHYCPYLHMYESDKETAPEFDIGKYLTYV